MTPTALRAARLFDGDRPVAEPTIVVDGARVVAAALAAVYLGGRIVA